FMITISPPNVALEDTRNTTKALNAVVHTLLTKKSLLRYRTAPKETWGYIRGTEWTGKNFKGQLAIGKTHPHVHLLLLTDWAYYTDKTKNRYINQAKHELTQMVKEQIAEPIAITDYNSNETDAEGNPIPIITEVNIADCNVHIKKVLDGREFIDPKSKKPLDDKIFNAVFEIIKGFNFGSANEHIDPQILEYAKDFSNEIKAKSKDALNYPDKGALSPEQIRRLGTMDREKNKAYKEAKELYEQGKISQEQLAEHEFKPYFMMFCEQIRGLRTFGSGGVFARCKLEQIGIDSPPEQAHIIRYDAKPAEQLRAPKGKDRKKHLAEYIHEQIGHSNCTLEPPQTALKGNEYALIKQAYGVELTDELTCKINEALESLDTSQQADKKEVFKAVNGAIQAYKDTFEGKDEDGDYMNFARDCPEFIDRDCYAYSMWALCKTAYAYATDKLNNGLSVFCDEHEQEKAIGALTAKLEKGGQHVRETNANGNQPNGREVVSKENQRIIAQKDLKDNPMNNPVSINLTIPAELLGQYQALEQDCQEQPAAIEQWALKALKWSLNRKYCKKCYYPMQCKQNRQDNSIFWKCSNPQCDNKEQFDPLKSSQAQRTLAGFYCDLCGTEREQWVYQGKMVYTCPNYKVCGAKMLDKKPAHLLQPKPAPQQQPAPQPQQYQPQPVPQSVPQQAPAQQPPVSVPQQQPESQMVEINDECPF
ncbi:protein rep, partial [Helicobacter ailurogastricus]|uniref:protein rep n=1 Tax=Helicobacter ailurogastricus TaxID=1578720 RepID=UPI001315A6D2